jgi:glycosyltransferase involved in cell wall biosynthesis
MNFRPYHIARQLKNHGVDVTVVSASTSHEFYSPPVTTGRYTMENVDGIRYIWIKTPIYRASRSIGRVFAWFSYMAGLWRLPHLKLKKPDIIIISSPPPYPFWPANSLARRYSSALVLDVRDLWPLSLVELGGSSRLHPLVLLTQLLEDWAYKRSDIVVSVLPAAKEYMQSHGLAADKFRYIPNGVDIRSQALPDPASAASHKSVDRPFPGRRFLVGYVGKVGGTYGLDSLVSAAALLENRKDIGIVVIGSGSSRTELINRAAEMVLNNIMFIPAIPKSDVQAMLASFDVCYLGLRNQALFRYGVSPTKLFDYMAASRPIIMAIAAGNDPVREAGCGISVAPGNPAALAEAICSLADTDVKDLEIMGKAGRLYLETNHDWMILGRHYMAALVAAIRRD